VSVDDGAWHHLVVERSTSGLAVFVDGVLSSTVADSGSVYFAGSVQAAIARDASACDGVLSSFTGDLAEVAWYPSLLSPAQVRRHWTATGRSTPVDPAERAGGSNPLELCYSCSMGPVAKGAPVDAMSGNFYHSFTDVAVGGRGLGLGFGRTYNSQSASTVGWLGHGWTNSWSSWLEVSGGVATVHQDSGATAVFRQDLTGAWTGDARVLGTLTHNSGTGVWTLVRNHDDTLTFRSDGHLTAITDRFGYTTTLHYPTGSPLPDLITESTDVSGTPGRSLTLGWSGTRLASVADPLGNTVSYDVNATTGDLDSVTYPNGGVERFTYDSSHRMVTMQSPAMAAAHPSDPTIGAVTNDYDGSGRVTDQWSATATSGVSGVNTDPMHFDYSVADQTTITDPEGNEEVQTYQDGFLTSVTKAPGTADEGTWSFEYDPLLGGRTKLTDPNGFVTTTEWYSDCTGVSDCAPGRVKSVDNGIDPPTTYTYDSVSGLPKTVTVPYGSSSTDTVTTTYAYLSDHVRLDHVSSPLLDQASPPNVVDTATVAYTYGDSAHPEDVTTLTDANGFDWVSTFDDYGNLVSTTDPESDQATVQHDLVGRPVASVAPMGQVSGHSAAEYRSGVLFDAMGAPIVSMGQGSAPIGDQFNRANATLSAADFGGSWTNQVGTFATDASKVKLSAASGSENMATVDTAADLTLNATVGVNQDGLGVLFRFQDSTHYWRLVQNSGSTRWDLELRNGASTSTPANTGTGTCCTVGQRVTVRTLGSNIKVFLDGVQKISTNNNGFQTATKAGVFASGTGAGRLDDFAVAATGAGVSEVFYDLDGNTTRSVDPNGDATATSFDADGAPTVVTRPDTTTLTYGWDGNHQRTSYTDGASNTTTYAYDHQGRLSSQQRPGMGATTYAYAYNPGGPTTTVSPPNGGTITSTADAAGRTVSVNYSGSTPDVTWSYDHNGHPVSMTTGGGTPSTWTWDSLGRMTASSRAGRSMGYGYDIGGNRTSVTYPGSNTVTYGYDDAGRMTNSDDWANSPVTFGWDENSNLATTTFPNGVLATRTYDASDRVTSIAMTNGATALASFTQTWDPEAQVKQIVRTTTTASTMNYTYNSLSKLTSSSNSFAFDAADNLVQTVTNTGANAYQGFNAANQLCWSGATNASGCTAPTGSTTYGYDSNGNRTSRTPASGSASAYGYDEANRLTSVTTGGSAVASYTYDGDGLRVSKFVNSGSVTTDFTWDESRGLPLLAVDGGDRYLYGPLGEPIEKITSGGTTTFIHQDHLGSTRILTDGTGVISGTYGTKPTGAMPSHTGTGTSNLTYAGQYADAETGFIYMRARYYEPNTGQFLTQDPITSTTQEAYGYVGGNSINRTDPSGLWCPLGKNDDGSCRGSGAAKKVGHALARAGRAVKEDVVEPVWRNRDKIVSAVAIYTCIQTGGVACAAWSVGALATRIEKRGRGHSDENTFDVAVTLSSMIILGPAGESAAAGYEEAGEAILPYVARGAGSLVDILGFLVSCVDS
jgi:RHS repeat-associated protein